MQAMTYGIMAAMCVAADRRSSMPGSSSEQPRRFTCAAANPGTSKIVRQTGVFTSVSLFVLAIIISNIITPVLLVVGLVVTISLLLTRLTGLVRLGSLVGLISKLATRNAQGD